MNVVSVEKGGPTPPVPLFSVDSLNVCYGDNLVLKDISFNINEGEFVAVIGHNGCGKSTLLKTLIGVKKYCSGRVLFYGEDVFSLSGSSAKKFAKNFSWVGQGFDEKVSLTVFDFVFLGRFPHLSNFDLFRKDDDFKKVYNVLEVCGIDHIAQKKITEISGGELKLAQIALALVQNDGLLILDEPVAYLDPAYAAKIMNLLVNLHCKGSTIIIVLHELNIAFEYCERILALKNGNIIFDDVCDNLADAKKLKFLFDIDFGITRNPSNGKPLVFIENKKPL